MMVDLLRDPKPSVGIDKPPADIRAAARAMHEGAASADQQKRLYRFIVHELCGISQLALALPAEESVANWRAGCRYPGLYLEFVRAMPVDDPPPAPPPARTMTERARRRTLKTTRD
jgi:hypothetical protein